MKEEADEEKGSGVQSKALDKTMGDEGMRLELLRRRLDKMEDDDPDLPKLIKERRALEKAREIRRMKRRLAALESGEDDDTFCY